MEICFPFLGFLVTDYLNGTMSPVDYCTDIHQRCDQYNGFNLLAGNLWYVHTCMQYIRTYIDTLYGTYIMHTYVLLCTCYSRDKGLYMLAVN